jgi:hypothetical protein
MSVYGSERCVAPVLESVLLSTEISTAFPLLTPNPLPSPLLHSPETDPQVLRSAYQLDDDFKSTSETPESAAATDSPSESLVQSTSQIRAGRSVDLLTWNCSVCTFLNPGSFLCCQICEAIRDAGEVAEEVMEVVEGKTIAGDEMTAPTDQDSTEIEAETEGEQAGNPFYYQLVAVVRHVGKTAFSGHYTCDVRHKEPPLSHQSGKKVRWCWYRCDDSLVTEITQVGSPSSPRPHMRSIGSCAVSTRRSLSLVLPKDQHSSRERDFLTFSLPWPVV